jgi:hypothetical protein
MKGNYWRTLTFKKGVIYLIKVNYTWYNYTPCNSTWTCLLLINVLVQMLQCTEYNFNIFSLTTMTAQTAKEVKFMF